MSIKESTMKELFAVSGNLCALCLEKGKTTLLVDGKGHFISEMAHIRAQQKGGPRYDPTFKNVNEACNLIALCNNCHEEIDKYPEEYSVERLENLKKNHEAKFTTAIRDLATIHDVTKNNVPIYPKTLNKLLDGEEFSDEEFKIMKHDIYAFITSLKELPANCRKFLEICAYKSKNEDCVLTSEIQMSLNISFQDLKNIYDVCNEKGFVIADKEENKEYFYLHYKHKLLDVFRELKDFSKRQKIPLSTFFENLDFSSLD